MPCTFQEIRDGNINGKHTKPVPLYVHFTLTFSNIGGLFPFSAASASFLISSHPYKNKLLQKTRIFSDWKPTYCIFFSILNSLRLQPSLSSSRIISGVCPEGSSQEVCMQQTTLFWDWNEEHLNHFVLLLEKIHVSNYCAVSIRGSLITKAACYYMYLINIISQSRIYTHFKRMTLTTTTSTYKRIRTC